MMKVLQNTCLAFAMVITFSFASVAQMVESFEGEFLPECWSQIDADGDGEMWFQYTVDGTDVAYDGDYAVASASWLGSPLTPDNYLITPLLSIGAGESLVFHIAAQDPDWTAENYAVYVSTTGNAEADFTDELWTETLNSADWEERTVDLSAYEGEEIYIAFRHYDVTDQFYIKLDNVQLPGEFVNDCSVSTAVEEMEMVDAIIYPNPSSDIINIVTPLEGDAQVTVFDNLGRTVSTEVKSLNGNSCVLNISELENGVYTLQIATDKGTATERFVKK